MQSSETKSKKQNKSEMLKKLKTQYTNEIKELGWSLYQQYNKKEQEEIENIYQQWRFINDPFLGIALGKEFHPNLRKYFYGIALSPIKPLSFDVWAKEKGHDVKKNSKIIMTDILDDPNVVVTTTQDRITVTINESIENKI